MTDLERHQAHLALISWFESQDIEPPDAAVICAEIIANMIKFYEPGQRQQPSKWR